MDEMTLEQKRALAMAAARMRMAEAGEPDTFLGMDKSKLSAVGQGAKDVAGGVARSGMGIVSNLMRPFEAAIPGGNDFDSGNQQRMAQVDQRFRNEYGVNPDAVAFQGGKLAGDVAATLPVGGALAAGAKRVPMLTKAVPGIENALRTGGFKLGTPAATTVKGAMGNAATRIGAGALTGGAMAGAVDIDSASTGAVFGAALPVGFKGAGIVRDKVVKPAARKLMQSAIKPTIEQLRKGDAGVAIDTLLKYGISPTQRGVEKLRATVDDINNQISGKLSGSTATVNKDDVLGYLGDTRSKFRTQVNPVDDLNAIQNVGDEFANHPYFQAVEAKGPALNEELQRATLGKVQALQAAGKLKTFAEQQRGLAHGGGVTMSPLQPQNQLYFNSGVTGRTALSPSAYPVASLPRIPGRYTNNIDRVPEGITGYDDAMAAYTARKADEDAAKAAVEAWQASRGNIPVQQAQKLKQGTYKVLKGKYGETGSASTEAQKQLARGLKDKIADVVPGIGELNAEEAKLLKTLGVTERRALMELNKNPVGLSALAGNPLGFAAFMADRSAAFKALAARMINKGSNIHASGLMANPAVRAGLLATQND